MKRTLREIIMQAIKRGQERGKLVEGALPSLILEYPKKERHGDYATNIALVLASRENKSPREVAETIVRCIEDKAGIVERAEVAGPGFINFYLREHCWLYLLREADQRGDRYGESGVGMGKKVLVEFPSANPTGPLHIGHGRIAALGDILANILEKVGYEVQREYYVNDIGTQMGILGHSVYIRYLQEWGRDVEFPTDGYKGDYIKEIARQFKEKENDRYLALSEEGAVDALGKKATEIIMGWIEDDLRRFRIHIDRWYREQELYQGGLTPRILEELRDHGYLYESDGALWFKSTIFGDEKDRVAVKANGSTTYFASDVAYHKDKYNRGYDLLINIWGADHHGYVPRMEAAVQAIGKQKASFRVILVQFVNLLRGGQLVSMSTRAGEFTTLRDVMDEVGIDACRYFFMLRRADSPLDFDLELAKQEGTDNPVYYVQYAHARIASIFKRAADDGIAVPTFDEVDTSLLRLPEERGLVKQVAIFPELLEGMALSLEPHHLTSYLQELASLFHSYYNRHRIISSDEEMTKARLLLVKTIKGVLQSSLRLLGVSALEEM